MAPNIERKHVANTVLAVFNDDDGDILAHFVLPVAVDLDLIQHSQGDTDYIRSYAWNAESDSFEDVDDALEMMAQMNVIDHKHMPTEDDDPSETFLEVMKPLMGPVEEDK